MSHIPREIAFVIDNLPDAKTLLAAMPASTTVHLLDAHGDALAQMATLLADEQGFDAIHLFSHGSQGTLNLGTTTLDQTTLNHHAITLASIGAALGEHGDLLLYGCNVAQGPSGVEFIHKIARATGADVAASEDLTGAAAWDGDWVLEATSGELETASARMSKALSLSEWAGILAPPTVQFATTMIQKFGLTDGITGVTDIPDIQINFTLSGNFSNSGGVVREIAGAPGLTHFSSVPPGVKPLNALDLNSFSNRSPDLAYFNLSQFKVYNAESTPITLTVDGFVGQAVAVTSPILRAKIYQHIRGTAVATETFTIQPGTWSTVNLTQMTGMAAINVRSNVLAQLYFNDFALAEPGTNTAPTLSTINTLPGATEDSPIEISYDSLAAAANEADADSADALGFRIEAISSGTLRKWNGSSWVDVTAGTTILGASEKLQWTPGKDASGSALNAFTVKAWDGTDASATAVQVSVNVAGVNDAPVLKSGTATLQQIPEDVADGSNTGTLISALIAANRIADADLGTPPQAIAISAVDNSNGTWQYKLGSGSWTTFDFTTYSGKALLLDAPDSVRFVPKANWHGTVVNGLTFHAWDKTSGSAGDYLTVSGNTGSDKTLSVDRGAAGITVTAVNDAPDWVVGITLTPVGTGNDEAMSPILQADGKLLVAGTATNSDADFGLVRYNTDGTLDTGFGTGGKVITNINPTGNYRNDPVYDLLVQPDGKIVLVGAPDEGGSANDDFVAVRYNTNGHLDSSFGTNGIARINIGGDDTARGVFLQSDGKLVITGYTTSAATGMHDIVAVRLTTTGALDTTFGDSGVARVSTESTNYERGFALLPLSNGDFIIGGEAGGNGAPYDHVLAKFSANGTLATASFGTNGTGGFSRIDIGALVNANATNRNDSLYALGLTSDGKIVAAGTATVGSNNTTLLTDVVLTRYNANGTLDTSFGTSGVVVTNFSAYAENAVALVIDGQGRIVISGFANDGSGERLLVARYLGDGTVDSSFGTAGKTMLTVGNGDARGLNGGLLLQADGSLLVTGYGNTPGGNRDFAVVRLSQDGHLYPKFTLTPINEDVTSASNTGTTIATLIPSGAMRDLDQPGVAATSRIGVTAVDNTNGLWQYKVATGVGSGDWTAFDFANNSGKALLLDATDSVRFVPNANWSGTVDTGLTFRGWDRSSGDVGTYLTVAGSTALTSTSGTAGILVRAVNDAPVVSTVTVTYTDTTAADAFASAAGNQHVGTLAYTDTEGHSISTWAIEGESTVSHTVNGVTYDRSKAGLYGTLYLERSTGNYLFVPEAAKMNAASATVKDTFQIVGADSGSPGATGTSTLTVVVSGTDDAPVFATQAAITVLDTAALDTADSLTKGGTHISGSLRASDAENGPLSFGISAGTVASTTLDGVAYSVHKAGNYGTLYVASDGTYRFVPDAAAVNALPAGNNPTDAFTVSVSDGGTPVTTTLTVNVTGANDAPVVAGTLTALFYADTTTQGETFANQTGTLAGLSTDVDTGASKTYGISGGTTGGAHAVTGDGAGSYDVSKAGATYGTLYLNSSTGAYVFVPVSSAIDALASTDSVALDFDLTVSDGTATVTSKLAVLLAGSAESPVVANEVRKLADTAAADTFAHITGTVQAFDFNATGADNKANLTYGLTGSTSGVAPPIDGISYDLSKASTYGTLYLVSTGTHRGQYVYVPKIDAVNGLSADINDVFTFTATDATSGTSSSTDNFTVAITATNDAPVLTAPGSITLTDSASTDTFSHQTGVLSASDAENNTLSFALVGASTTSTAQFGGVTHDLSLQGQFGTLYAVSSDATHKGQYVYVPDANAINALRVPAEESFAFTVSDGSLTDTKSLKIIVNGANDTPVLAAVSAISYTDTAGNDSFEHQSGLLQGSDRDRADTLTYGISGGSSGSTVIGAVTYNASKAGSYGTLYLESTTGAYLYAPDNAAIEGIQGGTESDSFTFTLSDGTAQATQGLTVNLSGANDPTRFGGVVSGSLTEGDSSEIGGQVNALDRDTVDAGFTAQSNVAGTYGVFNLDSGGTWTYRLNNNASAVKALAGGVQRTDSFSVSTPGGTTTVGVVVTGVNNAPTLTHSGAFNFSFAENAVNDAPANIGTGLTLADVDTASLSGGKITIAYTDGASSADQLLFIPGTDVTLDGHQVLYNGVALGSIDTADNGRDGADLVLHLNGSDTLVDSVQAVLHHLYYLNTSDLPSASRSLSLQVEDGQGGTSTAMTGSITVTAQNDAPTGSITIDGTAERGNVLSVMHTLADRDGLGTITYTWKDSDNTVLDTGEHYLLDRAQVGKTITVTASYTDGAGNAESITSVATAAVAAVNEAPAITNVPATAQSITVGSAAALADFSVADADGDPITVYLTPENGTLGGLNGWTPAGRSWIKTGSAAELNASLRPITFTATAAGAANVFIDAGDSSEQFGFASYGFAARNPPLDVDSGDTPTPSPGGGTTTVDGATVVTGTTTTTDGRVLDVVTVAPISKSRQETTGDGGRADIALFYSDTTREMPATLAVLPTGVGLTSTGTRTPADTAQALANLITLVNQTAGTTENNRPDMVAGGQSFLNRLDQMADRGPLIVNAVKLTVAPGQTTRPDMPITLSGTANRVTTPSGDGGRPVEAIVIDVRELPAGSVLELQNIEFAVIVGDNVTVRGGAGQNTVFAGAGRQNMVLGAEDDELSGGDGDDTVGSGGGNDQINGDAGNDWLVGGEGDDILNGGSGNDVLQGNASDAGIWRFGLQADGQTRASFQAREADFAVVGSGSIAGDWQGGKVIDARVAFLFQDTTTLTDIALLYQAVLNQWPTVPAMNAWSSAGATSLQLAEVAYQAYQRVVGPQPQALEVQVRQLITHVWGQATDAQVAAGVDYLQQGGTWAQGLLFLARHEVHRSTLLEADGTLPLVQPLSMSEMGWSANTGRDQLFGGAGNDRLVDGGGNNLLDGGDGTDLVDLFGSVSDFALGLQQTAPGMTDLVLKHLATGGVSVLRNVELARVGGEFWTLQPNTPTLEVDQFLPLSDFVRVIGLAEANDLGLISAWVF